MLSPAKMSIIKVTTRTSLEKKLIRALHDHSEIQFIDVEKKGLGSGAKVTESDNEREVFVLLGKISSIVDSLDFTPPSDILDKKDLDSENLAETLATCRKIYEHAAPEIEKISTSILDSNREIAEIDTIIETTKILNPLKVEFSVIGEGKFFSVFTGSIGTDRIERLKWNLKELTDDSVIFNSSQIEGEKGISAIVVGALHKYKEDITRVLASFGFVELNIPVGIKGKAEEIEKVNQTKKSDLQALVIQWEGKRDEFIEKNGVDLLSVKEQLTIEKERIEAKGLMKQSKYILQFWGYIPTSKMEITENLVKSIDPDAFFEIEEKEFDDDDYPTKMENHKYLGQPYEELVIAFGYPNYKNDYDPSLLFAFTFPLLFGIMFADIFHGILLILLGAYAIRLAPLGRDPQSMIEELRNYLQQGGILLFISGIASTIFGVFFWSFAGLHGDHAPSFMHEGGLLYFLKPLHLWSNDSNNYEMFAGANGSFLFIQLSLVVGILHIAFALLLLFINKIRHKHFVDAIFFPGMLLIGYISASLLVFSYSLDVISWFSSTPKAFSIAVLTPLIGYDNVNGIMITGSTFSLIMIVAFLTFIVYEVALHGMDGFSEGLDFTLSLLGNSVSYARLFAINIVHSILALLVYSAMSLQNRLPFDSLPEHSAEAAGLAAEKGMDLTNELMILFAFIIGTIIVMTFELMITFLQALRLHIVEFFSKLHFAGSGTAFAPFKSKRLYTVPVKLNSSVNT